MQQHGSKYCSRRHTATSGMGQKNKTFFSEINQVEDQIGVYSTLKVQMSKINPHKIKLKGEKCRLTLRLSITWSD